MGFNGYLLKIGTGNSAFTITGECYIDYASYDATKEVQDLDAYRDATGALHRNALPHIPMKVNFQTRPGLDNEEMSTLLSGISSNYSNALERKATVTAFIPELNDYVTQEMYMAGPTLKIRKIDTAQNKVYYESCKITFIGY